MTQIISRQKKQTNYEEDNWDDIEIPENGLLLINNNNDNDYGLSTTTKDISEITIYDSSDDDSEDDNRTNTPASSSSSINKVKEMMINSGVVITNNKEEFSGLITRIGGENNKVIAVDDDWDNDIEIPEGGLANLTINTNKKNGSSNISATNDFEFNTFDGEEQNTTAKKSITSPRELIIKQVKDPLKVFSKSNIGQNKKAIESADEDFDFSGVDLSKLDLSAKTLKLHNRGSYEEEGNEDPFGSERYSSRNSSRLSILPSPAPTNGSQSAFESGEEDDSFDDIQFPEHMDSLTLTSYNDDNDDKDFENGLDIGDESVFDPDQLKNKNIITRPNPTQQKRTRRESFSIEFNNSPKNSRSSSPSVPLTNNKVHPKTINNNSPQVSPLDRLKTNKTFSKSLTSLRTPTPTKNMTKTAKNQINRPKSLQSSKNPKLPISGLVNKPISLVKNTLERSKSTPNVINSSKSKKTVTNNSTPSLNKRTESTSKRLSSNTNNKNRYQQNINPNNTYNNNINSAPEIMRKPTRQQSFGDGTELDRFDDLPVNFDRELPYISSNCVIRDRKNSISSVSLKTDNSDNLQRHQKHKKNRKRKKPQLIRNLNADLNHKVVGEMIYNPITQRWDGNDSVLKDFDNILTSPTRPALISNMNNRTTNTKSFQVVGKMKFDPIKMCWNNDSSDEDEKIWASDDCDDDRDGFISPSQDVTDNNTSSANLKKTKLKTKQHDINSTSEDSNDFQVGSEFDITSGFLAALLASERQHRNEITRWYPDALSKKNDSRFGLREVTLQRGYLYDLRNNNNNNNRRNTNHFSSSNNSKFNHKNRSGGLFEAAKNLTRHERRHFR